MFGAFSFGSSAFAGALSPTEPQPAFTFAFSERVLDLPLEPRLVELDTTTNPAEE